MTKVDGVATGRLHISNRMFYEEFCYPREPDVVCVSQGAFHRLGYGVLKVDTDIYSILDQIVFIWHRNAGYTIYYFQYNLPSENHLYYYREFFIGNRQKREIEDILHMDYLAKIYHVDMKNQVFLSIIQWNSQSSAGQGVFIRHLDKQDSQLGYQCFVTGINVPKQIFSTS